MMDRDACPSPGVLQFMGSQRAGYDWATELNWTESIWTALKILFGRNDAKAETPVLWPPHAKSWLIGKDSDAARDWRQEEKGMTEDDMAGWHHWLDGRESEWTPGVGDGQGGLVCCNSWGHKELDTTERLNCTFQFSLVQSLSHVRLLATPWIAARQAFLSITNSWSSLRLTSIESVMPSSHLILCRPLLLLPPIPCSIRIFSNESALHMRWPKYWSFRFSIILSKEIPGLISFRMDWLDLLAVQGTLKSLLQHQSWKASVLWRSAFFTVQLYY